MHAVVVLRRQVDGREVATHERRSVCRIATQQFQHAEAVALGLEHAAVLDRAELADRAVGGAEDRARGFVQRTGTVFQCAGEERVEVLVGGQVFDQRLGHVHLITLGEPGGEGILEPAHAAFGDAAGQTGEQVVGQQVLAEEKQTLVH
ncbi:hypothetical protein D3C73_1366240 [compost metagenome]